MQTPGLRQLAAIGFMLGLALVCAPASAAVIGETLQQALRTAAPDSTLQVVVTFRGRTAPNSTQLAALKRIGLSGFHFHNLPIAGVVATPAQVSRLAALTSVRSLWLNDRLVWADRQSNTLIRAEKLRTEPRLVNREKLPFTGRGVGVVINDSGVDGTHPDLHFPEHLVQNATGITNPAAYGRLSEDPDFEPVLGALPVPQGILPAHYTQNIPNTDATGSHGTHVAGIVGGTGQMSGGKFAGVAPGANLVGYGSGAGLLVLDGLGGFDYTLGVQYHYNIRVINNSFGSPSDVGNGFNPDHPFSVAGKILADRGVIVVFAAGNYYDEDSIGGSWVKAPWNIVVGAGTKDGLLADFSSRGVMGKGAQEVVVDGETFFWEDRPTIVAPGQAIVSTRALSVDPVAFSGYVNQTQLRPYLGNEITPAQAPYYIGYDGTSMAAPHMAGVIALMLEANPKLGWREVKQIIEATATHMPGREPWEAGAGYVDVYNAVAMALKRRGDFGAILPIFRAFNSRPDYTLVSETFHDVRITTVGATVPVPFEVLPEAALIQAWAVAPNGAVTLAVTNPAGAYYDSGILPTQPVLDPGTSLFAPGVAGQWTATIKTWDPFAAGIANIFLNIFGLNYEHPFTTSGPGTVRVRIKQFSAVPMAGFSDVAAHSAAAEIELAARRRLVDGFADGTFRPGQALQRLAFTEYLTLLGTRQTLALNRSFRFTDVSTPRERALVEAALAPAGSLKDWQVNDRAPFTTSGTLFRPGDPVGRQQVAYGLVQVLGWQERALAHSGPVTAQHESGRVAVTDLATVPAERLGHVQLAVDAGLIAVAFYEEQTGTGPVTKARFMPGRALTRAEYAIAANRAFVLHRQPQACGADGSSNCLLQ